jgi:hypothetical protein
MFLQIHRTPSDIIRKQIRKPDPEIIIPYPQHRKVQNCKLMKMESKKVTRKYIEEKYRLTKLVEREYSTC